jgi:adenylate cyclase
MAKEKEVKKKADDPHHTRRKFMWAGMALTLLIVLLQLFNFFDNVELKSLDWRFSIRGPRTPVLKACVVAIDEDSLNGWMDNNLHLNTLPQRWIWPRTFWAKAIDNLREAGASNIIFDVTFSESTRNDPKQDSDFADAARRDGHVIFSEWYTQQRDGAFKQESLIPPLNLAKLDKGHAEPNLDPDGYIRSYRPLHLNTRGEPDPDKISVDLATFRQLVFGKPLAPQYDADSNSIHIGDRVIPLNDEAEAMINFCGPAETFPTFSFHDVYNKTMDMKIFKGKIVYIGSNATILHDNWGTAFGEMPGVETHAHMLDTLLSGAFLKQLPNPVCLLITLLLGFLVSVLTYRNSPLLGTSMMLVMFLAYFVLALILFIDRNMIIPMVAPLSSIVLSFFGVAVWRGIVDEATSRSTRAMFSRYVSKHIVDEILKDPSAVKLGGEIKETSILFSDVRGFTAMSEKLSAPEVVEVLNEYLTAMVDVVIDNDGTLDKYVGDAIMAVWGSPIADPDREQKSVKTAVQMMEKLHELQKKWKAEGKPEIDIGIGINTGHVVAGNMGHPQFKMDYTVIGDDVNLAARLESANKELKAHVLISGTTYDRCVDLVDVIKHPDIHVKGKEAAVKVYEIIGWKGQGRAPWAVPLKG